MTRQTATLVLLALVLSAPAAAAHTRSGGGGTFIVTLNEANDTHTGAGLQGELSFDWESVSLHTSGRLGGNPTETAAFFGEVALGARTGHGLLGLLLLGAGLSLSWLTAGTDEKRDPNCTGWASLESACSEGVRDDIPARVAERRGAGAYVELGAEWSLSARSRLSVVGRMVTPFSEAIWTDGVRSESRYVLPLTLGVSFTRSF